MALLESYTSKAIQSVFASAGLEPRHNCSNQPISFSIGVTVGNATLICDQIKVRTAGQTVNEAKRLQEAAGHGITLISSQSIQGVDDPNITFGPEFPVLVKKNLLMARQFTTIDLAA